MTFDAHDLKLLKREAWNMLFLGVEDQKQKSLPSFAWSLSIHTLILAFLIYFIHLEGDESGGSNQTAIQIESIQPKNKARTSHAKQSLPSATAVGKPTTREKGGTISLADLGLKLNEKIEVPSDTVDISEDWDLLNPDPRIARFNRYLYQLVQGWLDRESEHNINELYGNVKIHMAFDENGNYLENETVLEGIDPQFKAIVNRALKKSFTNPIPRSFYLKDQKVSLDRQVVIRM